MTPVSLLVAAVVQVAAPHPHNFLIRLIDDPVSGKPWKAPKRGDLRMRGSKGSIWVQRSPVFPGEAVLSTDVVTRKGPSGFYLDAETYVDVKLTKEGAEAFSTFTSENIFRRAAIVVSGRVVEETLITSRMTTGHVYVFANLDLPKAQALANEIMLPDGPSAIP